MALRTLVVKLVADTGQFKRGLKSAESVLTGFAGKIAALAGGVILSRLFSNAISQSVSFGDSLAKTSDRLGLTTQQLGALRHAGELAGVGVEGIDNALEQFVRRIGEAQAGTGGALDALRSLGLSAKDLAAQSPYQSLIRVSSAMQSLPNQAAKAAMAYDLFGRQGVKLVNLLDRNGVGLREAQKEIARFGVALDRTGAAKFEIINDQLFRLKEAFMGIKLAIGTEFSALLEGAITKLVEWATEGGRAANFVRLSMQVMMEIGVQAAATFVNAWTIAFESVSAILAQITASIARAVEFISTIPGKIQNLFSDLSLRLGAGLEDIGLGGSLSNWLLGGGKGPPERAPETPTGFGVTAGLLATDLENQVAVSIARITTAFDSLLSGTTADNFRDRLNALSTEFTRTAQASAALAVSAISASEATEMLKEKAIETVNPADFREIALSRTAIGGLSPKTDSTVTEIKKGNKTLTDIHRELKRIVFKGNAAVFA